MKIIIVETGVVYENQFDKIVIYGEGEKLYELNQSYLQESKIVDGKISTVYDGKVSELILNTDIKTARKENLNRKDNYTLSVYNQYSWKNKDIVLYIHCSEIAVECVGEYVSSVISGETHYKKAYKLTFNNPVTMKRCKIERLPYDEAFIVPDGCKWSKDYSFNPDFPNYDIVDPSFYGHNKEKSIVKRWIEPEYINEFIIECSGYSKVEKDVARLERETLAKLINEKKIFYKDVSHYEIENLLKYFNVSVKSEV